MGVVCEPAPVGHPEPGGDGSQTTGSGTTRRGRGELAIRRDLAPQTCIRSIHKDRNHDAVMRIGGEAPGGGPILNRGSKAMSNAGLPPPRNVVCSSASI